MPHTDRFGDKVKHVNTAAFFRGSTQDPLNKRPQEYSPENRKSNTRRPMVSGVTPMSQAATSTGAVWREAIASIMNTGSNPIRRA